jgi:outer membrane protein assembly factor BamB
LSRSPRLTRFTRAACFAVSAVSLAFVATPPVRAADVDMALPPNVAIGGRSSAQPGSLAYFGHAASSIGRSTYALPEAPRELWRRPVGAVGQLPTVGPDGSLYLALVAPELVKLDARGEEVFRTRLDRAAAVSRPALSPDGHVALVTADSTLVFVSPKGRLVANVALPRQLLPRERSQTSEAAITLLALADGAMLVAGGDSVVVVERSGTVRFSLALGERLAAEATPSNDGLLLFGQAGGVARATTSSGARPFARLPTSLLGPPQLVGALRMLLPVGHGRVLSLDLRSGNVVQHLVEPLGASIDAPLAIARDGSVFALTSDGFLVGFDPRGAERSRDPVELRASSSSMSSPVSLRPAPSAPTGFGRLPAATAIAAPSRVSAPAPLVDDAGRLVFLRPNGRLGLRAPEGGLTIVHERSCASPLAVVSIAPAQIAVVCREGLVTGFGDQGT